MGGVAFVFVLILGWHSNIFFSNKGSGRVGQRKNKHPNVQQKKLLTLFLFEWCIPDSGLALELGVVPRSSFPKCLSARRHT